MAVILPSLANSTARADRVQCFSNLRQIGVAYANFGLEHGDAPPWRVPFSQGGTAGHPLNNNLFVRFSAISNWLASPKLLADPGDERRNLNPARHWGTTEGGLWNFGHQNNSVSYFLGIDGHFRMTVNLAGTGPANGVSLRPVIAPAGQYVAYQFSQRPRPWPGAT